MAEFVVVPGLDHTEGVPLAQLLITRLELGEPLPRGVVVAAVAVAVKMLMLLFVWFFVMLILLTLCNNSLFNREFDIYKTLANRPYLERTFIRDSYQTFT